MDDFKKKSLIFALNKEGYEVSDILALKSVHDNSVILLNKLKSQDFFIYCRLRVYPQVDYDDIVNVVASGIENYLVGYEMVLNRRVKRRPFIEIQLKNKFIFDYGSVEVDDLMICDLSEKIILEHPSTIGFLESLKDIDLSGMGNSNYNHCSALSGCK